MNEWLTAEEIASAKLPDTPGTKKGVLLLAARENWNDTSSARQRVGRGGGAEYHFTLLPTLAQVDYTRRHMVVQLPVPTKQEKQAPDASMTARAQNERDARLAVVQAFEKFSRGLQLGYATRVQVFTDRYNTGMIEVADFVREAVPQLSKRSLARWQATKRDGKINALGHDPAKARKGSGVVETANNGMLRSFILGLIAHQPFLSAYRVRDLCRSEFGDFIMTVSKGVETAIPMPPVRTFQHALKQLKEVHKVELTKLTNPDLYRSTLAPSGVGTLRHIKEPNQLWQIDASPVDALCVDGRHSIYACIDIATRRMIFQLSRTPRASAVALLIRKAILAWGAPAAIKTDNGSDFKARDTQRLFASLDIEAQVSHAYSPQEKGHIERGIGTFQHDVGPLLPGFVGHSVADRKAIESRKSFAQRLGESDADTFGVKLTAAQLAAHIDEWALVAYQHRVHAGLEAGTPFKAALAASATIRRVDERALDLLLMPVAGGDGRRTVTKFGVRIDHYHYMTPNVLPGINVFVRQDPADLGRAFVFAEDGAEFLCEAICPELRGIDPQAYVREQKALQKEIVEERSKPIRDEARRIAKGPALIERVLDVAKRDAPNVIELPKREEVHTTPQITAAIEAMGERLYPSRQLTTREEAERLRMIDEMRAEDERRLQASVDAQLQARLDEIEAARTAHVPAETNVVALPEVPKQRYRRAVLFRQQVEAGTCRAEDAHWLGSYEQSAEFRAYRLLHEDHGEDWLNA